jgi:Coenzyme PQQ synthesis protein D (PqqD)
LVLVEEVGPVDGSFVAARGAGVKSAEVDDGVVLVDERSGRVLPLNATGALVWECFDGVSSLAEIASDLSEGLGAPYEAVLADTVGLTAGFLEQGMVGEPGPPLLPTRPAGPAASMPIGATHTVSLAFDQCIVRVRSNDPEMLELVRGALTVEPLVDDGGESAADLTMLFGSHRGAIEPLHYLYRRDELVFRSASRGRLLRASLAFFDAVLPPPEGTARLRAHAVVSSKTAVVVGGAFLEMLEVSGPRLARRGWHLVDTGGPLVDLETRELVVRTVVARNDDGIAAIDHRYPRTPEEARRPRDRYLVRGLVLVGSLPEADKLETTAQRLVALTPLVRWPDRPLVARDVELVRDLAAGCRSRWILGLDDQELLDVIPSFGPRR